MTSEFLDDTFFPFCFIKYHFSFEGRIQFLVRCMQYLLLHYVLKNMKCCYFYAYWNDGESFHWLQQAKALCQHRDSFSPNSLKNKSKAEHKMEEVKKCRTLVSHLACSKNKRRQQQKNTHVLNLRTELRLLFIYWLSILLPPKCFNLRQITYRCWPLAADYIGQN